MKYSGMSVDSNTWWGDCTLEFGESLLCELGDMRFAIQRHPMEWRVACEERLQEEQSGWNITRLAENPAGFEDAWERFVCGQDGKPLRMLPALADRPVICRPSSEFTLFPGEKVEIFVRLPLWVMLTTQDGSEVLKQFPLSTLSDTWFGPSTREGEICYAARTRAQFDVDALPHHPHRATTMVQLDNRAPTALLLERVKMPVTHLGLYRNEDGELWTEAIELVREADGDTAELTIRPGPPHRAGRTQRIAEPREQVQDGLLFRAFGSLFG